MSDMLFSTNQIIVRQLRFEDFESFFAMQSNPNVMRHIKTVLNKQQAEDELARFIEYYTDKDRFYNLWAIQLRNDDQLIGLCGVYLNQQSEYEIAYRLREEHWGRGLGKTVADALINHAFTYPTIEYLVAYVHVENNGSVKILRSLMKFIKETTDSKTGIKGHKYGVAKGYITQP